MLTYCSLSGGAERRRRDGIVLSTKSLIVTAEEKALLGGFGSRAAMCCMPQRGKCPRMRAAVRWGAGRRKGSNG